jgi:hypothetical protein
VPETSECTESYCQNCDWRGPDEQLGRQLADTPDLLERVDPGEPMPTGECPLCGALCQPVEDEEQPTANYMEHYDPDNMLGNVCAVIADRTSDTTAEQVAQRVACEFGDGDFTAAEGRLWGAYFGPLCDSIMADMGIEWA